MIGYTKNSKIRHVRDILARRANEADTLEAEFAFELSIVLINELLTGLTFDPEEHTDDTLKEGS